MSQSDAAATTVAAAKSDPPSDPALHTPLIAARNDAAVAKNELDRLEELHKKGVVTNEELNRERLKHQRAVATLKDLKEELAATIKDVKLQIDAVKLEADVAEKEFSHGEKLNARSLLSELELNTLRLKWDKAAIELKRMTSTRHRTDQGVMIRCVPILFINVQKSRKSVHFSAQKGSETRARGEFEVVLRAFRLFQTR
ncbi:MAG: hypothetical protein O2955_06340 [Planctomycetota bacterium]|nr:hypothetical protein [Planctomycetota bacterium]MDA1212113.1 hypothetical protein [Planctomycetota bacterium]